MKKLLPVLIALLGLAAGVGAGMALKPAPEAEHAAGESADCPPPAEGEEAAPCPAAEPDPFAPVKPEEKKPATELAYVEMDKPFVVPVFAGEKVTAMVVMSLSVETDAKAAHAVEAVTPRLRDAFLKVMFRHANSGGFDGSFTGGRKMEDLKSALLKSAREVLSETPVEEVLITEIARQDG
jgi:flagellar basal body-associated protein FliL